jgi:predicted MFS family arabinose efflux permease
MLPVCAGATKCPYLSILITGAGMFGIFLFLTYYMQETLGFSPVTAGLAFLPMVAGIVVCSNLANIVLLPRIGPRFLVASACSPPRPA